MGRLAFPPQGRQVRVRGSLSIKAAVELCSEEGSAARRLDVASRIVVVNETSRTLWTFKARARHSGSWGDDFLEGAILSGERAAWCMPPGTYHLRAETADGEQACQFGVVLKAGMAAEWVLTDG